MKQMAKFISKIRWARHIQLNTRLCFKEGVEMKKLTIDISDIKNTRLEDAIAELFPIPAIVDPNWKEKEGEPPPMIPKFTKKEWLKEYTIRYLIRQLARYDKITGNKKVIYKEEKNLNS